MVTALVDAALEAGAPDNVTCVVADVVAVDAAHVAEAPVVVGAAGEPRNRERLPGFAFPADEQIDTRVVKVSTQSSSAEGGVAALASVYHEEQRGPSTRRPWKVLALLTALVVAVAAVLGLTYAWAQQQYYIGNDGGYVAIFRGLPGRARADQPALGRAPQRGHGRLAARLRGDPGRGHHPHRVARRRGAGRAAAERAGGAVRGRAHHPGLPRHRRHRRHREPVPGGHDHEQPVSVETAQAVPRYRQPQRRWAEFTLLMAALLVGAAAYVQVDLAVLGHVADDTVLVLSVITGLILVAHLAVRLLAPYADPLLVPVVVTLNMLGLVMIHRLDLAEAQRAARNGSPVPTPDVYSQLTWTTLGIVLFVACSSWCATTACCSATPTPRCSLGLVLLLLPLVPVIGASDQRRHAVDPPGQRSRSSPASSRRSCSPSSSPATSRSRATPSRSCARR